MQDGRYSVVLSLLEAETLRAAVHFLNNQQSPPPTFAAQGPPPSSSNPRARALIPAPCALIPPASALNPQGQTSFCEENDLTPQCRQARILTLQARLRMRTGPSCALRVLPNGHIADSTANFKAGRPYQNIMAVQCCRFIDSETDYTPRSVSLLQRCLAGNTTEERTAFFHEVRACRRRSQQTAVQDTAVGRVLCKEEELAVLHQRAVATRIKTLLAGHNMGCVCVCVCIHIYIHASFVRGFKCQS